MVHLLSISLATIALMNIHSCMTRYQQILLKKTGMVKFETHTSICLLKTLEIQLPGISMHLLHAFSFSQRHFQVLSPTHFISSDQYYRKRIWWNLFLIFFKKITLCKLEREENFLNQITMDLRWNTTCFSAKIRKKYKGNYCHHFCWTFVFDVLVSIIIHPKSRIETE
jgi:hypothetical protein